MSKCWLQKVRLPKYKLPKVTIVTLLIAKILIVKKSLEYYLWHHGANMINALGDSIRTSADCHSSLRWIRQHFGSHLNWGPCNFSDLLYFWATFSNKWATLWGWYNKSEGDRGSGHGCRRNQVCQVLRKLEGKKKISLVHGSTSEIEVTSSFSIIFWPYCFVFMICFDA